MHIGFGAFAQALGSLESLSTLNTLYSSLQVWQEGFAGAFCMHVLWRSKEIAGVVSWSCSRVLEAQSACL